MDIGDKRVNGCPIKCKIIDTGKTRIVWSNKHTYEAKVKFGLINN
jgi:hypothetical protein